MASLKRSITAAPGTPMSILAKNRKVSERTIGRAVKQDLKLKSYKLSKKCILMMSMKGKRVMNGMKIHNDLKSHSG